MEFTKMHGLGNDFIVLDGINHPLPGNLAAQAIYLCHRHLGVGADGLVTVLPSLTADLRMRIINADGSEPAMCGNGIRCFTKYAYEKGLVAKERFTVETAAGIITPELRLQNGKVFSVRVNMGRPRLQRREIPMNGPISTVINEVLLVRNGKYHITSLLMNVPHTVVFVDHLGAVDPSVVGPAIEKHPSFPQGTNVDFVEVIDDNRIAVRTWERGVGVTLACGTGCCAAVVAAVLNGKTERQVTVDLTVGSLYIEWLEDQTVLMTGSAEEVYTGEIRMQCTEGAVFVERRETPSGRWGSKSLRNVKQGA